MTRAALVRPSDVKRFLDGILATGHRITRVELAPDGKVSAITESNAANDDSVDEEMDDL